MSSSPTHRQQVLYAAFPYGLNIPGGKWMSREDVQSALEPLQPTINFTKIVGRPDSILLWCGGTFSREYVQRVLGEKLKSSCVVLSQEMLETIVREAKPIVVGFMLVGESDTCPPYRTKVNGTEWEYCLVLSSDQIPVSGDEAEWLFRPTRHAVALGMTGSHALLVRKLRRTPKGTRVMLGNTIITPWQKLLRKKGVSVDCLTSRTFNRIEEVLRAMIGTPPLGQLQ